MQEGLAILIFTPLVTVTLVALFAVVAVLFQRHVSAVRSTASSMPGRSFLLGLVNILLISVVIAALGAIGEGGGAGLLQILAFLILAVLMVGLALGLAGMAALIGDRLLPEASPAKQNLWGSTAMVIASLTPVVGWFLLFPYLAFRGTGALVIGLFTRRSD